MEVLQDNDKMAWILNYISTKPNFYNGSEISNVKSYFRNGTRYARKVANFDPVNARNIYFRYFDKNKDDFTNLNCLDTSAGFGSRMSAVLLSGANYCGIDPNAELVNKLHECGLFYCVNNIVSRNQQWCIKQKGSEVFCNDLVDNFDVSFTSPPYFNLETYSNDNSASTTSYDSYTNWLNTFAYPTIYNTYQYLKIGGYAMINIKNMTNLGKHKLFDDFLNIFNSIDGFEFVEIFEMKHQGAKQFFQNSTYSKEEYNGFKEPVMSFRKVF